MTQVVSVTPLNPNIAARHAVASAVLVPASFSSDAAPSGDLIFTNVIASNDSRAQTPDTSIPVAMVITQN